MKLSTNRRSVACLLAAAAVAIGGLAASSAGAADLLIKSAPVRAVGYNWTGFYFGLHGGGAWGSTQIHDELNNPVFDPSEYKSSGVIVGGQLGANWQYGNLVLGAELDGSWASVRGPYSDVISSPGQRVDIRALATATGRIGYAMGPWLVYAKGGGAWADIKLTTGSLGPQVVTYNESWFGATGGAGMEVAFLRNVSAKVEYNFIYLPEKSFPFNHPSFTASIDHMVHLVKAGVNVKFGGDTPVVR
jgi:outer membrane immunogenic protein